MDIVKSPEEIEYRDLFTELSPSELKAELHKRGIDVVVFDLDDTLVQTHILFEAAREKFCQTIAPLVGCEVEHLHNILWNAIQNSRPAHSVQQTLWDSVINELITVHYGEMPEVWEKIIESRKFFDEIYLTASELRTETLFVLDKLYQADIPMYVVTHAEEEWTNLKIDRNDIRKYFKDIFIVPAREVKDSKQWSIHVAEIIKRTRTLRRNMLVIGDNFDKDIMSTKNIKIGHHGLVTSTPWSEIKDEELKKQLKNADNLVLIFNKILNQEAA